ncbi:3-dehydroquinate synthase [Buchnera aphidicola (Mindarus keteleerifoliae)]|uniref:3-dehydroquinate synthase n=1 Tax=Buchnera aphidicola TaxID=9 RepID=UPI0031B6E6A4
MEKLQVSLGNRSYPITIGSKILELDNIFWPLKPGNQAMLVTNKTLANIWKDKVFYQLRQAGIKLDQVILSDGEQYKTLNEMELIISALLEKLHNRDTTLIALGGGVIGDLTGFAASIYQRGVRFIQIPTTLLSQVDSSVGGKTGVNHILGKNMIGSFWQPSSVIIDINCLSTLPNSEMVSGIAEVIKYAIAFDEKFFIWLEQKIHLVLALNEPELSYCISKCCQLKSYVISVDEREDNVRALLNLGHTFGHAIEAHLGYGSWLHGEAVSVGIIIAARVSYLLEKISKIEVNRIVNLFKKVGLPTKAPKNMTPHAYLPYLTKDKKVLSGIIRFILPVKIGEVKIFTNIDKNVLLSAIRSSQ